MDGLLTEDEIELANQLGEIFTKFCKLEKFHPDDVVDFKYHIHCCQEKIMRRAANRAYPDIFPNKVKE